MSLRDATSLPYISANSDNRKFCIAIQRQKFCYESLEKAQRACDYSPNPQRPYYCYYCQAYHTTHHMNISKQAAINYANRAKYLKRKIYKNKRILFMRHFDNPTLAMHRVFNSDYRQVIKKYLVEYLDRTRDMTAFSDEELDRQLREVLINVDEAVLKETKKWPFCDLRSAMFFYALYWLQIKEYFVGSTAGSLIDLLFINNEYTLELKEYIEKKFSQEWIVLIGGVEYNGIYTIGAFNDEAQNEARNLSFNLLKDAYAGQDQMIIDAMNADYHPAVKELLLGHLLKHIGDEETMLEGKKLEEFFTSGILLNPSDEKIKQAVNETIKWRFKTERKACQFLMLYYFSISDPFYLSKLGDIAYQIFIQGNRSNNFIGRIKGALYKCYEEGYIIITEMRFGQKRFRMA